ncbi:MAG: hypothetical protein ACREXY_05030, partial [Gammaproteobacteria bacterium]
LRRRAETLHALARAGRVAACGIYLSDVCLAVRLSPVAAYWTKNEQEEAKETLYRYLRRVHQTALENGAVCPVACVVSLTGQETDNSIEKAVGSWGSDQDWHRGAFTLYVEDGSAKGGEWDHWRRLADLLEPSNETLMPPDEERVPHDGPWYAAKLRTKLENYPVDEEWERTVVGELVTMCTDLFALDPKHPGYGDEIKQRLPADDPERGILAEWKKRIVSQARDLAERSEQS